MFENLGLPAKDGGDVVTSMHMKSAHGLCPFF